MSMLPSSTRRFACVTAIWPLHCAIWRRGRLHAEFEVLGELGRGAFGRALKARRRADGSLVCLKVLDTQSMGATERRMVSGRMRGWRTGVLPGLKRDHTTSCPLLAAAPRLLAFPPAFWPACLLALQTRDEVRVLSSLQHPNIVRYDTCFYELGEGCVWPGLWSQACCCPTSC